MLWKWVSCSHVWLFVIPWTAACSTPPSMEFSGQEYWSRLPFPSPGDLPYLRIKPRSPTLQADSLPTEPCYSAIKRNAFELVLMRWMNLEPIIHSEVSQKEKDKYCIWMEEPGRLQSMGSLGVRHDWATSLSRIGEGNGNPLQCSCLENPRDRRAWWAAVYGAAQSQTWLKRLSSSILWNISKIHSEVD